MTFYRTYIDDSTEVGQETILGIQEDGTEFGIGISTDVICNNVNAGIITATQGFTSVEGQTPIQISLVGNQLTFSAPGMGSVVLTLTPTT
jgi:hypothetical protein